MPRKKRYTKIDRLFLPRFKKGLTAAVALRYLNAVGQGVAGFAVRPPVNSYEDAHINEFENRSLYSIKDQFENLIQTTAQCISALEYMRDVNRLLMEASTVSSTENFVEQYLIQKFGNAWRKRNRFFTSDIHKLYAPKWQANDSKPQDFMRGEELELQFDFNRSMQTDSACSSNYWTEANAGRIDVIEYGCDDFCTQGNFRWFNDNCNHIRAMQVMVNCPMPQLVYPGYYDFLCGKSLERPCRLKFKFIAKHLDCSPEGLRQVARHYLENYVTFNTKDAVVHKLLDQMEISDIQIDQKDYMDFCEKEIESDFDENFRYFTEDFDLVYDEYQECEVSHLTFVHFNCSFKIQVQLEKRVLPSKNLDSYRNGVLLECSSDDLLQRMRDIFEYPMHFAMDSASRQGRNWWWIIKNPTLETLKECRLKSYFHGVTSVCDVAQIYHSYGGGDAQTRLWPLVESRRYGFFIPVFNKVTMGNLDVSIGTENCESTLKKSVLRLDGYRRGMQFLLDQWDEICTPILLYQKIMGLVRADPVLYADSEEPLIAEYARNFL